MAEYPKILASDIDAVKRIGVEQWGRDFFWPISDERYHGLSNMVWNNFFSLFKMMDRTGQDMVLADSGFAGSLAAYIHAAAVREFCAGHGIELASGPPSQRFFNPDWESLAVAHRQAARTGTGMFKLKRLVKNVKFNSGLSLAKRMFGCFSPDALGLGALSRLKAEYAKQRDLWVDHTYWSLWLNKCDFTETGFAATMRPALEGFLEELGDFSDKEFGVRLDTRAPLACWMKRLADLHAVYSFVLEKKNLPGAVLVTEAARPLNRVIAHAFARRGKAVVGFHHGNDMGCIVPLNPGYNTESSYGTYVCPTAACVASTRRIYERSPLSGPRPMNAVSTDTSYYKNLWEESGKRPFPEKTKRVMLMGFPMNAQRYLGLPGYFSLFQLDLEIRLVKLLKTHGFEVLYKIHPERQKEAAGIFEPLCGRVVAEPFESVWPEADALLVKYTASTTFGFALCTNRPIFLFDTEKNFWDPEHYGLLQKRCRMVPAWMDENSRINFDEEALLSGLSETPRPPDFSYVKRFMFPEGEQEVLE